MKKILVLVVLLLIAGIGRAEVLDLKITDKLPTIDIPELTEGVVYSLKNGTINNAIGATLVSVPTKIGKLDIDALYIGENEPAAAICYRLGGLEQFGWNVPILKYVDVALGGYAGFQFNDLNQNHADMDEGNSLDYGAYARLVQVAF